jgi:small subunit ribosomal protein S20
MIAPFLVPYLGSTMANTDSARKRSRQAEKQRRHNSGLRSTLRSAIKDVNKAISAGDKNVAKQALSRSSSIVDRIADKKIIHKNKAARHKSRLAAAIKAMA